MLLLAISVVLVLGVSSVVQEYTDYDDLLDEDIHEDYGDAYHDGEDTSTTFSYEDSTINRVRRYDPESAIKTIGPDAEREVRGALRQMLSGIAVENPFTPVTYSDLLYTHSATPISTVTYDTTFAKNTTYSTITPSYLSTLLTEIYRFTNAEPTRSKDRLWNKLARQNKSLDGKKDPLRLLWWGEDEVQHFTTSIEPITVDREIFESAKDLDVPRLLAIISKLASDFETNLTRKLNNTLITMTLPECTTPTTLPPVTSEYDANYSGSIISKCFVCGLMIPGIPQNAHCADAFAGDFLPLVPIDPTAKGKISRFKKYCKYASVSGYVFNRTQPRLMMGRWTGGCAVRWIDLSGVYTQRTCRNRIQPAMGKHFASKRMAKLERTLWNVENGCITSPMATLVPLSRGISLYARFHACVCTGSWCNFTSFSAPYIILIVIVSSLLRII